jgi:hypothetical protein
MKLMISGNDIKDKTAADTCLSKIVQYVKQDWPAEVEEALKPYLQVKNELSLCSDCVFHLEYVVFPETLRRTLMELAHEGHHGIVRTLRVQETSWWPGMSTQVRETASNCTA